MATDETDDDILKRERALALLEATHQFPCEYTVTVIAFNQETVTAEVRRAVAPDEDSAEDQLSSHQTQASSQGKYLSHRIGVRVTKAVEVLALYARLRSVDGVVTLL